MANNGFGLLVQRDQQIPVHQDISVLSSASSNFDTNDVDAWFTKHKLGHPSELGFGQSNDANSGAPVHEMSTCNFVFSNALDQHGSNLVQKNFDLWRFPTGEPYQFQQPLFSVPSVQPHSAHMMNPAEHHDFKPDQSALAVAVTSTGDLSTSNLLVGTRNDEQCCNTSLHAANNGLVNTGNNNNDDQHLANAFTQKYEPFNPPFNNDYILPTTTTMQFYPPPPLSAEGQHPTPIHLLRSYQQTQQQPSIDSNSIFNGSGISSAIQHSSANAAKPAARDPYGQSLESCRPTLTENRTNTTTTTSEFPSTSANPTRQVSSSVSRSWNYPNAPGIIFPGNMASQMIPPPQQQQQQNGPQLRGSRPMFTSTQIPINSPIHILMANGQLVQIPNLQSLIVTAQQLVQQHQKHHRKQHQQCSAHNTNTMTNCCKTVNVSDNDANSNEHTSNSGDDPSIVPSSTTTTEKSEQVDNSECVGDSSRMTAQGCLPNRHPIGHHQPCSGCSPCHHNHQHQHWSCTAKTNVNTKLIRHMLPGEPRATAVACCECHHQFHDSSAVRICHHDFRSEHDDCRRRTKIFRDSTCQVAMDDPTLLVNSGLRCIIPVESSAAVNQDDQCSARSNDVAQLSSDGHIDGSDAVDMPSHDSNRQRNNNNNYYYPIPIAPRPPDNDCNGLFNQNTDPTVSDYLDTNSKIDSISVEGVDLEEMKSFAKLFKLRRLALGLTQTQVGQSLSATKGPAYSQSAICRFEKLDITPRSAAKIKPVLEKWMLDAEKKYANRVSSSASRFHATPVVDYSDLMENMCSKQRKRRTSFTPQALDTLNKVFASNRHPSGEEMTELSHALKYGREVIRVWFCNKRQSLKSNNNKTHRSDSSETPPEFDQPELDDGQYAQGQKNNNENSPGTRDDKKSDECGSRKRRRDSGMDYVAQTNSEQLQNMWTSSSDGCDEATGFTEIPTVDQQSSSSKQANNDFDCSLSGLEFQTHFNRTHRRPKTFPIQSLDVPTTSVLIDSLEQCGSNGGAVLLPDTLMMGVSSSQATDMVQMFNLLQNGSDGFKQIHHDVGGRHGSDTLTPISLSSERYSRQRKQPTGMEGTTQLTFVDSIDDEVINSISTSNHNNKGHGGNMFSAVNGTQSVPHFFEHQADQRKIGDLGIDSSERANRASSSDHRQDGIVGHQENSDHDIDDVGVISVIHGFESG